MQDFVVSYRAGAPVIGVLHHVLVVEVAAGLRGEAVWNAVAATIVAVFKNIILADIVGGVVKAVCVEASTIVVHSGAGCGRGPICHGVEGER